MLPLYIYLPVFFIVLCFALAGLSLAPYVPVRRKDLRRILALAAPKPGELFVELGSGDGRTCHYLACKAKIKTLGIEINPILYSYSLLRAKWSKTAELATFKLGNLFNYNLSQADIIFVFGMPKTIKRKLSNKLLAEIKPGARVISYAFNIDGLTLLKKDKPTSEDITLYLYQK